MVSSPIPRVGGKEDLAIVSNAMGRRLEYDSYHVRPILVLILSLLLLVLTACGGGADEADDSVEAASFGGLVEPEAHPEGTFLAGAAVATAAPAATAAPRAPVAASAPRVTGLPGPSPADEVYRPGT